MAAPAPRIPTTADEGPMSYAIFQLARAHRARAAAMLRGMDLHPGQELLLMHLLDRDGQTQSELDLTRAALAAADKRKRAGDTAAEEEIHVLEEKLVAGPGGGADLLAELGMRADAAGGTPGTPGPLSIRTPVRIPVLDRP